jgi:hypothetical protein
MELNRSPVFPSGQTPQTQTVQRKNAGFCARNKKRDSQAKNQ